MWFNLIHSRTSFSPHSPPLLSDLTASILEEDDEVPRAQAISVEYLLSKEQVI